MTCVRYLAVVGVWTLITTGTWANDLAAWRERLTFHASFDKTADADVARGDTKIYTATALDRKQVTAGIHTAQVTHEREGGRWGGCLRFHDVGDAVVFYRGDQNMPYATTSLDMTVSFWLKLTPDEDLKPGYVDPLQITDDQWNDSALFVDFTKDDVPRHVRLGVFADYAFWNPQNTDWDQIAVAERPMVDVANPPFSRDAWTHVAFVLQGINGDTAANAKFYLNGKLQGELRRPQKFTWDPQRLAIMLGIQYIGAMDEFCVFQGAMSDDEIQSLGNLERGVGQLTEASLRADQAENREQLGEWQPLFNGRDLDGWQVKIRGYDVGDNFGNTFRVVDGKIQVGYEAYDEFNQRYGHLFYKQAYSDYDLRVEYRFVGEQANGGEGWAFRNSGVMVHGQDPATMTKEQRFPASIEVQLLGGGGTGTRTTANLCTPGTHVVMDGQLVKRHCTSSTSETYHGDQWVTVLIRVRGNRSIEHIVDGRTVLAYTEPQLDEGDEDAKRLLASRQDRQLSAGTISLQSESHPVEFRKVELRVVRNP